MKKVIYNNLYIFKKIWGYSKLRIILSFLLSIISTINLIIIIFFDKLIIDALISHRGINYIIIIIGIRLGILLVSQCSENIFYIVIFPHCDLKIKNGFIKELYNKVKLIDLFDFDDSKFYDKYIRALNEADSRAIEVLNTLNTFITNILQLIVLTFTLVYFSPLIIIIAVIGMLVTLWANIVNTKKAYKYDMLKTRPARYFDYIKRIFYMPQYAKDIRTTNLPEVLSEKFEKQTVIMKDIVSKYSVPIATIAIAGSWLFNLVIVGFSSLFIVINIIKNIMTIGDLVSINHAVNVLSSRLVEFSNIVPQLTSHSLYIDNYLEVMNYQSKMVVSPSAVNINPSTPHKINLNDVSFAYKNSDKMAIEHVTLCIKAGEHIAIVGENGAGKSTLVKLIIRLYDPNSGNIYIDDVHYNDVEREKLNRAFSIVQQDFQTYAFTLKENIILSKYSHSEDDNISDIIEYVGLNNKVNNLPNGLDSILSNELDEEGINFSLGQLQRLSIARAIYQNSSIIVMDEPSSSLDPIYEAKIFDIIDKICENKTIILISHRLSSVKNMDRILFMENGKIAEEGSHKELMELNQKYAYMYRTQAERYADEK